MSTTAVGVFATRTDAEQAVAALKAAGYRDDQIGLVAKDAGEHAGKTDEADAGISGATIGAAAGAGAGVGVGGLVGLGIMTGVIPVIGPVLALGTLATVLLNAAGGAVTGGLAGALAGRGLEAEAAKYYESEVNAGRYLVTAERGAGAADPTAVFARHGGYDPATAPRA